MASLILVTELFRKAQEIAAFSQQFMLLYVEAAVVYWVICLFLSGGRSRLDGGSDRCNSHTPARSDPLSPADAAHLLRARGLRAGGHEVLKSIDLTVGPGQVVT